MMKHFYSVIFVLSMLLLATSCRDEEDIVGSTKQQVVFPDADPGEIKGFFLLNEGNMGSNKSTIDYFDYETGIYTRNIFAERNPGVVKELGDVGNDIKIYGDKLFAVINCSHFIEVMDVNTLKHKGAVSIPNCRNIVFKDKYAYVSSYSGPVEINPNARLGYVAKIDTASLQVVNECIVGYQPEEMVVVNDKLYVANSGGYRVPDYDNTISVIDLHTFTEIKKIEVAINLRGLELDRYGNIWVSSRGDYYGTPSKTFVIDSQTDKVINQFDLPNSNMTRSGDSLYICSSEWSYVSGKYVNSYAIIDTYTREIVDQNFIKDNTDQNITIPYGIAVNPVTKEIFVTDAKDYVTPGKLHCYSPEGKLKWSVTTGDIPAHIVFSNKKLQSMDDSGNIDPPTENATAYITKVFDFMPAVGQYTNLLPLYEAGDTQENMNQKVLNAIGNNKRSMISLGGFGGYVVIGFDHTIENVKGKRDFRVLGNAFYVSKNPDPTAPEGGSCEPGIIMVAYDQNKNGVPDDDEWYEIAGSAHENPKGELWYDKGLAAGNDMKLYDNYEITYFRPEKEPDTMEEWDRYIRWEDNYGKSGYRMKNAFYEQSYFPLWAKGDKLTFKGTCLPQNSVDESGEGNQYVLYKFSYGYADNETNDKKESTIDIDWAINSNKQKISLPGVDFIKIYSAVNQENGWLGECSTEFAGVEDLHILGIEINTQN